MPHATTSQPEERVVAVIGGTSGIGLAAARLASEQGFRVVVGARDADRVREVAESLPGAALGVAVDVVEEDDVQRLVEACLSRFGRLDGVVLSAQTTAYGDVVDVPPEVVQRVMDTATLGLRHVAAHVLPVFEARGGGTLVVVGSLLGQIAVPSMGVYCAAKWAQLALVRSIQAETVRQRDVHVCTVLPGAVDTPIYQQAATYAGAPGHAPPPVISARRVALTCLQLLDRPRRLVHTSPLNRVAVLGHRMLPGVYDRLAPRLVRWGPLRGSGVGPTPGNVLEPVPGLEAESGGWTPWGTRRRRS